MKTKITILDLLYSGWWWVTCIFRAVFVIFVLNNKGGDDGACYLSLVEFIVFPFACFAACSDNAAIFSVGPISSSFLSSPASPASLSNTAVFCGTKDFLFLFFPWSWRCEYVYPRASGEHSNRCPTWEPCLNTCSPLCFGTGRHFVWAFPLILPKLKGDVAAGLSTCLADPPEKYFVLPAGRSLCLLT